MYRRRAVVEERRRHLLGLLGEVMGVALDPPTAGLRDELERPANRDLGHAPAAIASVDEDAGDSVVR